MNKLIKVLAPAAIALAAFGAQAGTLELDYPSDAIAARVSVGTPASGAGTLLQPINEAAPAFTHDKTSVTRRTREEVREEALKSPRTIPGVFA